jgi:hypothetical protein
MTDEALRKAALKLLETADRHARASGCPVPVDVWMRLESLRAALPAPTPEPSEVMTQEQVLAKYDEWHRERAALGQRPPAGSLLTWQAAYAAGRASAGKDAEDAARWRYVRSHVSRILNEKTLKMDGMRVEVYYDTPQPFCLNPVDKAAMFDAAIDRAMSEKEPAK